MPPGPFFYVTCDLQSTENIQVHGLGVTVFYSFIPLFYLQIFFVWFVRVVAAKPNQTKTKKPPLPLNLTFQKT